MTTSTTTTTRIPNEHYSLEQQEQEQQRKPLLLGSSSVVHNNDNQSQSNYNNHHPSSIQRTVTQGRRRTTTTMTTSSTTTPRSRRRWILVAVIALLLLLLVVGGLLTMTTTTITNALSRWMVHHFLHRNNNNNNKDNNKNNNNTNGQRKQQQQQQQQQQRFLLQNDVRVSSSTKRKQPTVIKVFSLLHDEDKEDDHPVARKQREDIAKLSSSSLSSSSSSSSSSIVLEHVVMHTKQQQRLFLQQQQQQPGTTATPSCGNIQTLLDRFDLFLQQPQQHYHHLAMELVKYCALYLHAPALYLDSSSPLLASLEDILSININNNMAVINDPTVCSHCIHGSFLFVAQRYSNVMQSMIQLLLETPLQVLTTTQPLLLSQTLYQLIIQQDQQQQQQQINSNNHAWHFLQQTCHGVTTTPPPTTTKTTTTKTTTSSSSSATSIMSHHSCPPTDYFCCQIYDNNNNNNHIPTSANVIMMTPHPLLPYQLLPSIDQLPKPYNYHLQQKQQQEQQLDTNSNMEDIINNDNDLPYIATIQLFRDNHKQQPLDTTPNFFDILLQNDCLPADAKCASCLRNKGGRGASCQPTSNCYTICSCYCKALCHVTVPSKFVRLQLIVMPPLYRRPPQQQRLIPRIIHQTWYEPVSLSKYPNMSRLIQSFRNSGWDYRFYTDEMAASFLSQHFPLEIRQAYDALRPGAFKADLFRYCVLLIHGGVYADMDVMLESNLDFAIDPNVGFMVPMDEPGTPINLRMCLWNGLIAAAPGHVFMAKVIERVVNNIRNRFTSVDYDHMFCPDPELSILHAFDTLFTAGPCILGTVINQVLGRPGQTQFAAGDLAHDHPQVPGRTIILHQNKWDMGAHRFTLLEKNMVVAGTDFPEYDDRQQSEGGEHYSKTHVSTGIYGVDRLYNDNQRANEELRFYVGAPPDEEENDVRVALSSS